MLYLIALYTLSNRAGANTIGKRLEDLLILEICNYSGYQNSKDSSEHWKDTGGNVSSEFNWILPGFS